MYTNEDKTRNNAAHCPYSQKPANFCTGPVAIFRLRNIYVRIFCVLYVGLTNLIRLKTIIWINDSRAIRIAKAQRA